MPPNNGGDNSWNARGRVDAFSLFTGALAVQESLQLDAMTGAMDPRGPTKIVPFEKLQGPTIKSHPWEKMLGDQQPDVSPITKYVPSNQYLVQARSLTKLLELVEIGDLWSMHLFNQAVQDATSSNVGDRLPGTTRRPHRPVFKTVLRHGSRSGCDHRQRSVPPRRQRRYRHLRTQTTGPCSPRG